MKVKDLVFMAMYIALALVLDYVSELIPFLQMPMGGSINLAVIPVIVASYHMGWKNGALVGLLWWFVGFIMFGFNRWYLNPAQYLLDYIIPAAILGFASIMPKFGMKNNLYTGIVIVSVLRFACNLLSGVFFYFPEGSAPGSLGAWIYSFNYNIWYNLATMVAAIIIAPILIKRLPHTKF